MKKFGKVLLSIAVVLLVLVILAELGLRWFLGANIAKQFEGPEKPEVSFGTSPLVFGLAQGELKDMTMRTPSTLQVKDGTITGQPASTVHVEGMHLGEPPIARHLQAQTTLPEDFLLVTVQNGIAQQSGKDILKDIVITNLTTSVEKKAVDVEFAGGLFTLTLVPHAQNGALAFEAISSKILAWELPEEASTAISEALSNGMQQHQTGDMRITDVEVTQGAVELTMEGENVNMNELSQTYQGQAAIPSAA